MGFEKYVRKWETQPQQYNPDSFLLHLIISFKATIIIVILESKQKSAWFIEAWSN